MDTSLRFTFGDGLTGYTVSGQVEHLQGHKNCLLTWLQGQERRHLEPRNLL